MSLFSGYQEIHKHIFKAAYSFKRRGVIPNYFRLQEAQWLPFKTLKDRQEEQLAKLINWAYENVPYYNRLFHELSLIPEDVRTIEDLQKLPILTKQTIKQNWADFTPRNIKQIGFVIGMTSGSTGAPFKYRMSKADREMGIALMLRGNGYAGYEMGDKIAVVEGSPPNERINSRIYRNLRNCALNYRFYSFSVTNQAKLSRYHVNIRNSKPPFVKGRPSTIYSFAKYIKDSNLQLGYEPTAIFTTGEKLLPYQRAFIEKVFGAKLFDSYGLNDGGISAYECDLHCGMHIDMERGILEVVDDEGRPSTNRIGKIIATSLYNYALPFIRYDTGDLGIVTDSGCDCSRETRLLKEVVGRTNDSVSTPSGLKLHEMFFSYILVPVMDKISQFQVIQNKLDEISISIVPYNLQKIEDVYMSKIKKAILKKDGDLKVKIECVREGDLEFTTAGKYKFIVNNMQDG